jgi:D-alanyl-D-alanine carboxypeptidase
MKGIHSALAVCLIIMTCFLLCACEPNTLAENTNTDKNYNSNNNDNDIADISITKTHIVLSGEYNRDLTVYGYTYYLQANNGIDIYAFTNPEGNICLRAACAIKIIENDNIVKVIEGICAVKVTDNGTAMPVQLIEDVANENFGMPTITIPEKHQVPNGYFEVKGVDGCFYFINKNNEKVYRTFAAYPNTMPVFYPSDSSGNIPLGALKVDIERDTLDFASTPSPTATPAPTPKPTPEPYFIGDAPFVLVHDVNPETLININFRLSEDYVPADLVKVSDYIDTSLVTVSSTAKYANPTALEAFSNMIAAAKEDGVTGYYLRNAYRSYNEQVRLWNYRISQNKNYGRVLYEPLGSAYPGSSEHQTGYAFDITCLASPLASNDFRNTENFKWLSKNAHKFGFILRYNYDKTRLTGIKFEPYHYRYVGVELATYLYENNLCLEEYYNSPVIWK